MSRVRLAICFFSCLALGLAAGVRAEDPLLQTFTLQEHLDHDWHRELVIFPLESDATSIIERRTTLRGPDGEDVPSQRITRGGKSHIAFLASLPALSTVNYTLHQTMLRPQMGADAEVPPGQPQPVTILETTTEIRLSNGLTGVIVPTSDGEWRTGPIVGLQTPGGSWIRQITRLSGIRPVAYDVTIVERGPVFGHLRAAYKFAGGETWTLDIRLIAGEPVALIEETTDLIQGPDWTVTVTPPLPLTHSIHRVSHNSNFTPAREEELYIRGIRRGATMLTMRPWVIWSHPLDAASFMFLSAPSGVSIERPDESGWEVHYDAAAAAAEARLVGGNVPAAPADDEPIAFNDTLLIGAGRATTWTPEGGEGFQRHVPLRITEQGKVEMLLPPRAPGRTWFMGMANVATRKFRTDEPTLAQAMVMKHFDRPLQRVRQMVLAWEDNGPTRPRLLPSGRALASLRKSPPPLHDRQPERAAAKKYLLDPEDASLRSETTAHAIAEARGIAEHFLSGRVDSRVRSARNVEPDKVAARALDAAGTADVALATEGLTPEQRELLLARLAFSAYSLASPDYHSPAHGLVNIPSMTSQTYGALGALALVLADHPEAEDWLAQAIGEFERQLEQWSGPNGGWLESPGYQLRSMEPMLLVGIAAQQAGLSEFVFNERLKKTMLYLAKIGSPRDPRFGNFRHLPPLGNTYRMVTSNLFAMMAHIWREKDAEYARTMQWVWEQQGKPRAASIGGDSRIQWISDFLYEERLAATAPKWTSELFPRTMAILRAGFNTPRETAFLMHQGEFHGHYDDDQGAFTLWGKGQPLVMDWGSESIMPAHLHNRVNAGNIGQISRFAAGSTADYLRATQQGWHRQVTLVRDPVQEADAYFVLRDSLAPTMPPAMWHLWLNTLRPPELGEHGVLHVRGRGDVDMDLWLPPWALRRFPRLTVAQLKKARAAEAATSVHGGPASVGQDSLALANDSDITNAIGTTEQSATTLQGQPDGTWAATPRTQQGLAVTLSPRQPLLWVMAPRLREEPSLHITPLPDDIGMRIESSRGVDYVIQNRDSVTYERPEFSVNASAALIQQRGTRIYLTLFEEGTITSGGRTLKADKDSTFPVSQLIAR